MSIELKMCAKRVDELTEQNAELLKALKDAVSGMHVRSIHVPKEYYKAIAKAEGGL